MLHCVTTLPNFATSAAKSSACKVGTGLDGGGSRKSHVQQCLHRFGLVRSYGLVSQPGLACAAFDEMRRLGVWQPNDVKTANALLNAVHADATTTYERYMHVCRLSASTIAPDWTATPPRH